MLRRMSAALAVAGVMAIGGSGVAIASHGADDPAGHEQHITTRASTAITAAITITRVRTTTATATTTARTTGSGGTA